MIIGLILLKYSLLKNWWYKFKNFVHYFFFSRVEVQSISQETQLPLFCSIITHSFTGQQTGTTVPAASWLGNKDMSFQAVQYKQYRRFGRLNWALYTITVIAWLNLAYDRSKNCMKRNLAFRCMPHLLVFWVWQSSPGWGLSHRNL